jgi:lipid II:glycine glycyltransferase (peptidoglycan interpeptide bridge formation enzyme)
VEYDLWGVPDEDLSTLEANFTKLNAGLWGVYRFKRGFGGELMHSIGPWDRIYKPVSYRLYSLWLKYRKAEGQ